MSGGTVYRIANWREQFETAKSRGYAQLSWIACPVSFNSRGFQALLDDFEPAEAAALFGCWQALCKVAAANPDRELRGVLAGSHGEPYTVRRLERLTGFPAELFETVLQWAKSVDWLEPVPAEDSASPQAVPAEDSAGALPNITKPDKTKPHTTQQAEPEADSAGAGAGFESLSVEDQWEQVEKRLREVGVTDTKRARMRCRLSPAEVLAIVAEFARDTDRFASAGALIWRLENGKWPGGRKAAASGAVTSGGVIRPTEPAPSSVEIDCACGQSVIIPPSRPAVLCGQCGEVIRRDAAAVAS